METLAHNDRKTNKKELETQTVLFEQQVQNGTFLDGNITVSGFIESWFKEYAESQLKVRTLQSYKDLVPRITQALGHIKLCKLQPHHLMEFYNNLTESGIRLDTKYKAIPNLKRNSNRRRIYSKIFISGGKCWSIYCKGLL